MTLVRNGKSECNTGSVPIDGLPPGWCRQGPVNDVSLYQDKRVFFLRSAHHDHCMRAKVARTVLSGKYELFTFDVNWDSDSELVVWLENPQRGFIELLDVQRSPDSGSLDGAAKLRIDEVENVVTNFNSSPVYLAFDFEEESPAGWLKGKIRLVARSGRRVHYANPGVKTRCKLRAAELQRTTLYAPP